MERGALIEFRADGQPVLAVVDRPEGKQRWVAIDDRGRSHVLRPRDVTYQVQGDDRYTPADIPGFRDSLQPYLDPDHLEVAWELLVEEGEAVAPPDLAELLFSDRGPVPCYAAHALLAADKLYFKQKGDRYEPRPASQVAEIRHQQVVAEQRQQEQQGFLDRVRALLQGTWDGSPEDAFAEPAYRQRIDTLERYAALGDDFPGRAGAVDLLAALGRPSGDRSAFALLTDLGLWSPHENLFLRRAQIPIRFSEKVLELARDRLQNPPADRDRDRLDLTGLKLYTIDDESTREIDDGLSVEPLPDGRHRLWIHIADPTRWLVPGDDLELDARRRSTTIYLPTGAIPMFPPELATGPMSLVQGQTCCALSFGVVLQDSGAIDEFRIHPSLVKPTYRLTYDDADEMLQLGVKAESELEVLAAAARQRETWRSSQGAIRINMPESSIKVYDDDIAIQVLNDSPARHLVAEMMILTGEVAARYGQEQGLPLPFRHQPQPELPSEEELLVLPAGPVRDCAIRRCMPRSEVSITPARHASLALDTYTQVTSPIRRYADLLSHFQIKAHLRGDELPFSREDLQLLLQSTSATAYEAILVERQTNRYWVLEYLRRQGDADWSALVLRWLREDDRLGIVLLEDLGIELVMRFQHHVALGDRLRVRVARVDPRQDVIQFEQVDESAATARNDASECLPAIEA